MKPEIEFPTNEQNEGFGPKSASDLPVATGEIPWSLQWLPSGFLVSGLEPDAASGFGLDFGSAFGSTGPPCSTQAFHPPFNANTFLNPLSRSCCAARALVASDGQLQ